MGALSIFLFAASDDLFEIYFPEHYGADDASDDGLAKSGATADEPVASKTLELTMMDEGKSGDSVAAASTSEV